MSEVSYGEYYGDAGETTILINNRSTGDPLEQVLAKDVDLEIPAATVETSTLVCTLRRCVNSPAPCVELDSVAGLSRVAGVVSPDPAAATLVRTSDSLATLHIDAIAIAHLRPGEYQLDLTELTIAGKTHLRHTVTLFLVRAAGRRMAE
ncbi:hypothetical protein [Aureliella helgolandensis]|uniref:Uncharacterized protein n=1 Tax=Aureliella helgolandensis TaxID=2527968 RepID=A0A518GED7_9BACT|nr:hypothetical protein [Aureliella helgolandensis]QDV26917.1 hypothetical protein Q31a_52970 [Aureliella helgolandensis]